MLLAFIVLRIVTAKILEIFCSQRDVTTHMSLLLNLSMYFFMQPCLYGLREIKALYLVSSYELNSLVPERGCYGVSCLATDN